MSSFLSLFQVSAPAVQATGSETARPERTRGANDTIANAFASASQTTGLPFDYFMTTAMRESSLDVNAAASTSSARGPFQFIEQTWLGMVHEHGSALGLDQEAAAIEREANGRFSVTDPQARQDLLAMRHDPELSAVMSGLYLQGNASDLEAALGRPITVGEGYVAHVFGPSGATRMISLAEQQPNRVAADVFPTQARANQGLFYDRSGSPVSVRELYDRLVEGFPSEAVRTDGVVSMASASTRAAPAAPVDPTQPMQLEPDGFDALPQAAPRAVPDDLENRGLFTAGGRDQLPFFAALYRPDGVNVPQLGEEFVATHDGVGSGDAASGEDMFSAPSTSDPFALHDIGGQGALIPTARPERFTQANMPLASTSSEALPSDLPLDLLQFVQSGTLADRYRNPARELAGSELVPPV